MPTIRDLRNLAPELRSALGSYWCVQVYTRQECIDQGYAFDPPCAYLEARCTLGKIRVCPEGDIYFSSGTCLGTPEGPVPWRDRVIDTITQNLWVTLADPMDPE